jgi:hypothetical protein
MRETVLAALFTALVFATTPALATSDASGPNRTEQVHRYYAGTFDGLPQSRIVIDRFGRTSLKHLNYVVRMKCKGPNTRLNSSFEDVKGNPFDAQDGLGGFRGAEGVKGTVGPAGGNGSLRAHLRGMKHSPHARRCDTGRVTWSAERVSHREYKRILRNDLGVLSQ